MTAATATPSPTQRTPGSGSVEPIARTHWSGVAGRLLSELNARGQPEFRVDVGEVGLHGARRDEKPGGDVVVAESLADQADDGTVGGGE